MNDNRLPTTIAIDAIADRETREVERAGAYERASLSVATLRAYAQTWRDFEAWTRARGLASLPAASQTVGRYLSECADRGRAVCPVGALRAWMDAAAIAQGPLFRTFARMQGRAPQELTQRRIGPHDVARIVQRAVARAGLLGDYAAHSLRAGFITAAAASGVSEIDIARVSRHKSADVLRGYVRRATALEGSPLSVIVGSVRKNADERH